MVKALVLAFTIALAPQAPVTFEGVVVKEEAGYKVAQLTDGSYLWFISDQVKVGQGVKAYFEAGNTEDGLIKVVGR